MASEHERLASRPQHERLDVTDDILPRAARAAVFDVDGTLLDSNARRVESWSEACRRHGLHIDKDKYLKETGRSGRDIVDLLCKEQGVDLPEPERASLVEDESNIFTDTGLPESGLIPVVLDIVGEAKRRGLKLAVCSGGQAQVVEQVLRERGLGDTFDAVVTSKDVPHAKPAPDIFRLAAERLGVEPGACVAYEDAEQGVVSARSAGYMAVVDVTHLPGHPEREERHGPA